MMRWRRALRGEYAPSWKKCSCVNLNDAPDAFFIHMEKDWLVAIPRGP